MNENRDRIAQAIAAQQRMREIETYNRIQATPDAPLTETDDPILRSMRMSNEVLRASPRVYDAYMQGVSMPQDPRIKGYRR